MQRLNENTTLLTPNVLGRHFGKRITFIVVRFIKANWDNCFLPFNLGTSEKIDEVIKRSIPFDNS